MKILLTGANGFLGKTICQKLSTHEIITIGRHSADIEADLSEKIEHQLPRCELIIHAAGKAHSMPRTDVEKEAFFKVNVQGTTHLLDALDKGNVPDKLVFISTVSVYGMIEGIAIDETYPLLARDAYGKSKIEAERIIMEWCNKRNVCCTILRLPLLVGKNAPGNLGNMINAIRKGYYFNISNGSAKKSMVLAEDVANSIIKISEMGGIYNLTDSVHPSMKELADSISRQLGKKKVHNLPIIMARSIAFVGDLLGNKVPINSDKLKKLSSSLTFDDSKARSAFDWSPRPVLDIFKI